MRWELCPKLVVVENDRGHIPPAAVYEACPPDQTPQNTAKPPRIYQLQKCGEAVPHKQAALKHGETKVLYDGGLN